MADQVTTTSGAETPSAPTTPPGGVQGSASGPVSSGGGGGSGTTNPTPAVTPTQAPAATPASPTTQGGFTAANSPATQAAGQTGQAGQATPTNIVPTQAPQATFDDQFRQRYGMEPAQANMLLTLGWRAYQGQGGQAANPQAQPGGQPAAARHPWDIPQIDRRLLSMVEKDPTTGALRPLPGAPPDAALQVQKYLDARQAAVDGLFENPMQALRPIVTELARAEADRIVQERMGGVQAQGQVNAIIQQNSEWLFQKDQNGHVQRQFNPATGQQVPVLSPVGRFYAEKVQQLHKMGVTDPAAQHEMAVMYTRQALADVQARQSQAQQQGQQQGQQFVAGAAAGLTGNPHPQPAPSTNPAGEPPLTSATLREVMMKRLEKVSA
jgi:hypothetical protein